MDVPYAEHLYIIMLNTSDVVSDISELKLKLKPK